MYEGHLSRALPLHPWTVSDTDSVYMCHGCISLSSCQCDCSALGVTPPLSFAGPTDDDKKLNDELLKTLRCVTATVLSLMTGYDTYGVD